MHSSLAILCSLAQMVVSAATYQHQKRENSGNVDLKRLNSKRSVGYQSHESEEDNDDFKWEPNVALDEDNDKKGDNKDGENEILIEAQ
jgi:hypothetical protein